MKPRVLLTDVAGEGVPLVLIPGGVTGWLSWIPHQELLEDMDSWLAALRLNLGRA